MELPEDDTDASKHVGVSNIEREYIVIYEGESNETLKKCDKNSKHDSIVCKFTTVIMMV